jgi:hypothetical protein
VGELIFYFSSEFNKRRFINGYEEYIVDETHKLESKYHVKLDLEIELTIAFYKKIEKRGFRITNENGSTIVL